TYGDDGVVRPAFRSLSWLSCLCHRVSLGRPVRAAHREIACPDRAKFPAARTGATLSAPVDGVDSVSRAAESPDGAAPGTCSDHGPKRRPQSRPRAHLPVADWGAPVGGSAR